jgi:hypothetical protein
MKRAALVVLLALAACRPHDPPARAAVELLAPGDGVDAAGELRLEAFAVSPAGIRSVDFLVGEQKIGTAPVAPYTLRWNASTLPRGTVSLVAEATDGQGNKLRSAPHALRITVGRVVAGPETVYDFLNEGTLAAADELLNDIWTVSDRFPPVEIRPITWHEDPYNETYWRFLFYSLRPTTNLLWAYGATGDTRYRDKLLAVLSSYADYDRARPPDYDRARLDDRHTAAFRTLVLAQAVLRLSRQGDLPAELATRLRFSLEKLGDFLEDLRNYDGTYNHGYTEAAALLLLGVGFPDLAHAARWQTTALQRIELLTQETVDDDGVEVEKSAFYHFYVMTFAAQIDRWARAQGVPLSAEFSARVDAMSVFATFITQPDGQIPLLGASVALDVLKEDPQLYASIGARDGRFQYVRTGGASGVEPSERNVLFPGSGLAVLRSGFGRGAQMLAQSHVAMNVGPYRTLNSHLDGLALTYYSAGRVLLPDSGLFTYVRDDDYRYFHGTAGHNTILVDGQDQAAGPVQAGLSTSGPGWAYQSGQHSLFTGVTHRRAAVLLAKDLLLCLDALSSDAPHDYALLWHFAPEATVSLDGLAATAVIDGAAVLAMTEAPLGQLTATTTRGATTPVLQGWYSSTYGVKVPSTTVTYAQHGGDAAFATAIGSGASAQVAPAVSAQIDGPTARATVCAGGLLYTVAVDHLAEPGEAVSVVQSTCR